MLQGILANYDGHIVLMMMLMMMRRRRKNDDDDDCDDEDEEEEEEQEQRCFNTTRNYTPRNQRVKEAHANVMAQIAAGVARPKNVDIFWIRWLDVDDFFPAGSLAARRISKFDHIHRRCVFASCKT